MNLKKIFNNSVVLSARMLIILIVNLFTLRILVKVLGMEDYGVNDIVVGISSIFLSLSTVISTAAQRFYSYYIGKNKAIRDLFLSILIICIVTSLIVLFTGEIVGLWLINYKLKISANRIISANYVYQFSLLSVVFVILQIPYLSAIIAYENMSVFALVNIMEGILKLALAFSISFFQFDHLIVLGIGLSIISLISLLVYHYVFHSKYENFKYSRPREKSIFFEFINFSGFNLLSPLAGIGMSQILNIIFNVFFGTTANASRAIAFQFNNIFSSLISGILLAVRPQMTSSYSARSYKDVNMLFNLTNKGVFYGMVIFCIPIFILMESVLRIWLNISDENTILFSRLVIIFSIIMALNNPIAIIINASGNIKKYQIVVESVIFLSVPFSFIFFKIGYPAYSSFIVMIFFSSVAHILRIKILSEVYSEFKVYDYLKSFIFPALLITVISFCYIFQLNKILTPFSFYFIFLLFLNSFIIILVLLYLLGLNHDEKLLLKYWIISFKKK